MNDDAMTGHARIADDLIAQFKLGIGDDQILTQAHRIVDNRQDHTRRFTTARITDGDDPACGIFIT